jgi:hypothetical protein
MEIPEMQIGPIRPLMLSACLALVLGGCGSGEEHPPTIPVKGKVTHKGQPVTTGTITFQPGSGQAATGQIQADGSYELSTYGEKDGAVEGHHKVMVVANDGSPNMIPGSTPGYKPGKDLVPKKYNNIDTSGLEATVSKDKPTIDFDLP